MRGFQTAFVMMAVAAAVYARPGGVLANVQRIHVDPTVVAQPDNVKDSVAPQLVRFDLRAAIRDAYLEEGDSPIRAHIVLDEFSTDGTVRRVMNFGSGHTIRNVDARLVIQDATGKELANIKIHVHGTVAFGLNDGSNPQTHQPASDLEHRLLEEIERLK